MGPIRFVQARNYRPMSGRSIELIVLHSMESPEKPDVAENIAAWFASVRAPMASAHYLVDSNSIVQCVRDQDVAWGAPGANARGLQIEHAGRADDYSHATLELSAELVASLCKKYGIPIVALSPAELLVGYDGITTHAAVTQAFKQSDHWDPGPDFPMASYLERVGHFLKEAA
jgi:N-acetyl-anhydromuramyl-L-alanine amidase AmpD